MVSLRLEFLQRIGSKDLSELMDHVARNHNDMDVARYTAMAHLVRSSDGDWVNTRLDTGSGKGVIKAKKKTGNTVVYAQIGEHRLGCAVSVVSSKMKKVINRAKRIYKTCKYSQPLRMNSKYYDCSSLV